MVPVELRGMGGFVWIEIRIIKFIPDHLEGTLKVTYTGTWMGVFDEARCHCTAI
jgi:hypothetical protein